MQLHGSSQFTGRDALRSTKAGKKAVKQFRPRKFEDFEIPDGHGDVFGHVQVKPSGVLWCRSGGQR